MKLFEMEATLALDTSDFATGATSAVTKAGEIKTAIDNIDTDTLDAEIAALDRDIDALDDEIHRLDMSNLNTEIDLLDAEIDDLDAEIADLERDIGSMDDDARRMGDTFETVVDICKEVAIEVIQGLIEFADDSVEVVANSGSEIGEKYKQALSDWDLVLEGRVKINAGSAMASFKTWLMEMGTALADMDFSEKMWVLSDKLAAIEAENLIEVQEALKGVFGEFDKWDPSTAEEALSVTDMTGNLQSQIDYWTEYDRVIKSLQDRGLDANILAQYADGSQESLQTLQELESASEEELSAFESAYEELENTRTKTAETLNIAQLQVNEAVDAINDKIAEVAVIKANQISQESEGNISLESAIKGVEATLSYGYGSVANYVDAINAKIAELPLTSNAGNYSRTTTITNTGYDPAGSAGATFGNWLYETFTGRAVGLDYVPYNDYPARLHEGEAVLTKAEATAWRRGENTSVSAAINYDLLAQSVANAMSGVTVNMDKVAVGHMVSTTVSEDIARTAKSRRYT